MNASQKIFAVDVCGTLYAENTTAALVAFHHRRCANTKRLLALRLISDPRAGLRQALVLFSRLTGIDLHRKLVLLSLRGVRPTALEASAATFHRDHLSSKRIAQTHDRLRDMQAENWTPILISNAIAPMVREIAVSFSVPFLASELEVRDGRYTGRLDTDLVGNKRQALETVLQQSLDHIPFAVMTDNRSDVDLVVVADPALLVAKGAAKKWMEKLDAEILFL